MSALDVPRVRRVAARRGPARPDRIGLVLAAGGERLVAWYAGVLAGLADAGVDPCGARAVVGTSAGALVAARVAAGNPPRAAATRLAARQPQAPPGPAAGTDGAALFARLAHSLATAPGTTKAERRRAIGRLAIERSPGGAEEHVARMRRRLAAPGGADGQTDGARRTAAPDAAIAWPAALRIVALDAETGERVAFDAASGAPLERAVAAARSVPLLHAPVEIGDRVYLDGALASSTNADVLADEDELELAVVVTGSAAGAAPGTVDALWNAALERELGVLEAAGIGTLVLRADAAAREAMGPDPMSGATAQLAVAEGRRQGRALAAKLARAT